MIFSDRWGSPPALDGEYSSGTEEEFYRALGLLGDGDRPMRDILVLFKSIDPERIPDAGPDLKAVLDFRASLEKSKSLMYETFESEAALQRILGRKLLIWVKQNHPKEALVIDIPKDHVDTSRLRTRQPAELLESARSYAAGGFLVQAEAAFA